MKKYPRKQWHMKKKKTLVGLSCLFLLIGLSLFLGKSMSQKQKEVAAHPTSTITLDEGGTNEYQLPTDATRLTEDRLINDTSFDGYKQNDGFVLNPTKINVRGFSTVQPKQNINFSEKTNKGNVLAIGVVSNWDTGVSYQYSTTFLLLLNDDNQLLDSKQIEGTSLNQTYGGWATEATYSQKLPDGSFILLAGSKMIKVSLNAAETSISFMNIVPFSFQGSVAPTEMSHNSVQMGLDNKIYYSGHWFHNTETTNYLLNGRTIAILDANANEQRRVKLKYNPCSAIYTNPRYMRIQYLSGMNRSATGQEIIGLMTYTSLDNKFYSKIVTWDINGNMRGEYAPAGNQNTIKSLDKISSTSERFFIVKAETKTEIMKYEASSGQFTQVAEFPAGTDFEMIRLPDGSYNSIGYLADVSGVFAPFHNSLTPDSTFSANFSSDFSINSTVSMVTGLQHPLEIASATFLDNSRYFFSARFSELDPSAIPATSFIDGFETALGINGYWQRKSPGANMAQHNIFGILEMKQDHKPAMYAPENILYNIDDRDLDNPSSVNSQYGWSVRDNWLITGKKNGTLTESSSIKVFDVYDTELSLNPQPNSWHYNRLNRNPKAITADMEWAKLGLNESNTGPQLLTYFVTDTQNQVTTRSRWINKTTDQTAMDEDDKYALDALNFHVPLTDIGTTIYDAATFKRFAKTMAWNLTQHGAGDGDQGNGLDEDGTDINKLSDKVTINSDQLEALQEATVAKPYPVDVTYKPEAGVTIVNRVWVFVTTKNTVPNSETTPAVGPDDTNGVVYYADDYSMPFRMRHTHTEEDVRTRGNLRVYDYYDASHERVDELPTIVDMSQAAERQKLEIHTIGQVNNAPQPGLLTPPISVVYKWDLGTDNHHTNGVATNGSLDITLFSDVLLHVRQIIRDPSTEIVVPDEGYLTIRNTLDSTGSLTDFHAQVAVDSSKQETMGSFTTFAVETEHLTDALDQVNLSAVIPEFYQYVGYHLTDQTSDPGGASHLSTAPVPTPLTGEVALSRSDIDNREEFWLTLYLKPVKDQTGTANKTPQPYSWNYKHNELGEIKPN